MLFCVYMDELLNCLAGSHVGCHIGNEFLVAFSYADDLTLVAPLLSAVKWLLNICDILAKEYDV